MTTEWSCDKSLAAAVIDLNAIRSFDSYKIGDIEALYESQGRPGVLLKQVVDDFDIFQQAYKESIEENKYRSCISEYRGDWGERKIHQDLDQSENPSERAKTCLQEFRDIQVPIKQRVLYCCYPTRRGTPASKAYASIESTLTSTTTSLPVLFENSLYNSTDLFVIFIREGSMGVPIFSAEGGMGRNEDCEVLLCDKRKPEIVGTAYRKRDENTTQFSFSGHTDAIAIFKRCTADMWSTARAKTLHLCQF